jgi:hypothetical protein
MWCFSFQSKKLILPVNRFFRSCFVAAYEDLAGVCGACSHRYTVPWDIRFMGWCTLLKIEKTNALEVWAPTKIAFFASRHYTQDFIFKEKMKSPDSTYRLERILCIPESRLCI